MFQWVFWSTAAKIFFVTRQRANVGRFLETQLRQQGSTKWILCTQQASASQAAWMLPGCILLWHRQYLRGKLEMEWSKVKCSRFLLTKERRNKKKRNGFKFIPVCSAGGSVSGLPSLLSSPFYFASTTPSPLHFLFLLILFFTFSYWQHGDRDSGVTIRVEWELCSGRRVGAATLLWEHHTLMELPRWSVCQSKVETDIIVLIIPVKHVATADEMINYQMNSE